MSEQADKRPILQRLLTASPQEVEAYWKERHQNWRTEPEIDDERKAVLETYQAIVPDAQHGIFPFKGVALSRADVEWLLATHDNGRGPVDWSDESQRNRQGLDLRGADLRHVNLQSLPLARLLGDITWDERTDLTEEQRTTAAVLLDGADLKGTHLEGARLSYAHMKKVDLRYAHLEQANLSGADMTKAYLLRAHLEKTDLFSTHLDDTFLWDCYLAGASLRGAHMDAARLDRVNLVDEHGVSAYMVDVRWGDVNLSLVDWSKVLMLGEEARARQTLRDGVAKSANVRLNEYEIAVRANRQLAVVLQAQGLNEDAARFAYRAQLLQRVVLRRRNKIGQYLFSCLLAGLAGYGYRPGRSLIAYLVLIFGFAILYTVLGQSIHPAFSPLGALIFSVTSFHGRGFFPGGLPLDHPMTAFAALEAIMGLLIEISFIATFTQRFFSK